MCCERMSKSWSLAGSDSKNRRRSMRSCRLGCASRAQKVEAHLGCASHRPTHLFATRIGGSYNDYVKGWRIRKSRARLCGCAAPARPCWTSHSMWGSTPARSSTCLSVAGLDNRSGTIGPRPVARANPTKGRGSRPTGRYAAVDGQGARRAFGPDPDRQSRSDR